MAKLYKKLASLSKNRYFIYTATIFLAFVAAFILILISFEGSGSSTEVLRQRIDNNSQSVSTPKSNSLIDNVLISLKLKKADDSTLSNKEPGSVPILYVTPTSTPPSTEEILENIKDKATMLPKIDAEQFVLDTTVPSIPEATSIYQVKTDYTTEEVKQIARTIGLDTISVIEKSQDTLYIHDNKSSAYIAFSTKDGQFLLLTQNGLSNIPSSSTPADTASKYLASIGINQACTKPYLTYKRSSTPSSQYIEFHCDWDSFGAPILNALGIFNTSQSESFTNVQLAKVNDSAPDDEDIIESSDGNKKRKSTDFNTIVVQVKTSENKTNDYRIEAVSSNIPFRFDRINIDADKIIQPSSIISQLESKNELLSFTTPVGTGYVDLNKVYPENTAQSSLITIKDLIFAYDLTPEFSTSFMCPVYFARGFGKLSSGYDAQFLFTTQAIDDPRCNKSQILGVTSNPAVTLIPQPDNEDEDAGLKYTTFEIDVPTTIPTQQPPSPPMQKESCPPDLYFNHAWSLGNNKYIVWADHNTSNSDNKKGPLARSKDYLKKEKKPTTSRTWYLVTIGDPSNQTTIQSHSDDDIISAKKVRIKLINKCTIGDASECLAPPGLKNIILSCTYITKASPRLYFYTEIDRDISVSVQNPVYIDPEFTFDNQNLWVFKANPNGLLQFTNGLEKDSLYWEFAYSQVESVLKKHHITKAGYIVKKEDFHSFALSLLHKLDLNDKEIDDYMKELKREIRDLDWNILKISFVNPDLLDNTLPTEIQPKPDNFYRIMLYIQKASPRDRLLPPNLPQVIRSGFTVIETGVIVEK